MRVCVRACVRVHVCEREGLYSCGMAIFIHGVVSSHFNTNDFYKVDFHHENKHCFVEHRSTPDSTALFQLANDVTALWRNHSL